MQSFTLQKRFLLHKLEAPICCFVVFWGAMALYFVSVLNILHVVLAVAVILFALITLGGETLALPFDLLLPRKTALLQFGHLDVTPFPGEENNRWRNVQEKYNPKWNPKFYGRLFFYYSNKPLPLSIPLEASREEILALPKPPQKTWIKVTYYRFSRILISWEVMPVKEKKKCRTWK